MRLFRGCHHVPHMAGHYSFMEKKRPVDSAIEWHHIGDETVGVLLVEKRSRGGGSHADNTLVKAAAKTRLGSRHEESRCMSTNTRATNTASYRPSST